MVSRHHLVIELWTKNVNSLLNLVTIRYLSSPIVPNYCVHEIISTMLRSLSTIWFLFLVTINKMLFCYTSVFQNVYTDNYVVPIFPSSHSWRVIIALYNLEDSNIFRLFLVLTYLLSTPYITITETHYNSTIGLYSFNTAGWHPGIVFVFLV